MGERAVFLDCDGTLVQQRHDPSRSEELSRYAGIETALQRLQAADFRLVRITNQAGPTHGYVTAADLEQWHADPSAELEQLGVRLDAVYHCSHQLDGTSPESGCVCRNPQPGLLLRAAVELDLDLQRSWFVGDTLDNIEAGKRAGCGTILVDLGTEAQPMLPIREPHFVARDAAHALEIIATFERLGPVVDLSYLPYSWEGERELAYGA